MNRRGFLLGAAAALCSGRILAASERHVDMIYIASFTCGECRAMDQNFDSFSSRFVEPIHFAPVAESLQNNLVRGWYGLSGITPNVSQLRKSLFSIAQELLLPDPGINETIEYLRLDGIEFNLDGKQIPPEELAVRMNSQETTNRLLKAVLAADMGKVEYTPAVVFSSGKTVLRAIEKREQSALDFMGNCEKMYKELKS